MQPSDGSEPQRPAAQFPEVADATGARLRPGQAVLVRAGPYQGTLAEVTGWGGRRGVELLVHTDPPDLVALPPTDVQIVDVNLMEAVMPPPAAREPFRTLLVHPVGTRDVTVRPEAPSSFARRPGAELRTHARHWGQRWYGTVAGLPRPEQVRLVRQSLAAPILERALTHLLAGEEPVPGPLGVLLVVSDQPEPERDDDGGHWGNDTLWFGRLIELWLEGSDWAGSAGLAAPPVAVREPPNDFDKVFDAVASEIAVACPPSCELIVVSQAGGTPAMSFGTLFAAVRHPSGIETLHLNIPEDGDVSWRDFPGLVKRDRLVQVARNLLQRREPGAAREVISGLERVALVQTLDVADELRHRQVARDRVAELPGDLPAGLRDAAEQLAAQPPRAAATTLAAWEVVAAYEQDDLALFFNLLSALFENLPAHLLLAEGVPIGDLRAFTEVCLSGSFEMFAKKHRWHLAKRERVRRLLSDPAQLEKEMALAVFDCLGSGDSTRCPCGLDRERFATARLAVVAFDAYRDSALYELRNRSILSHAITPVEVAEARRAIDAVTGGVPLQAWLADQLNLFRVDMGTDVVGQLCEHARARLP